MKHAILFIIAFALTSICANAQTAASLFLKSDKVQTDEIFSEDGNLYNKVGHHGPAVENNMMALRLYFNDSGAIDVYSKSGAGMELLKYLWYPTGEQQIMESAGCDEYRVGNTVGLGGIALWDDVRGGEVKLQATKGRRARVGVTRNGRFAEMIAYGVPYKGNMVDISIRVDVTDGSRFAKVTATELNGKKVSFLTGVNYHPGAQTGEESSKKYGQYKSAIWAWGVHPADVSANPIPIGGGLLYNSRQFPVFEKTEDMLRIISVPSVSVTTMIVSASTMEAHLNTAENFRKYLR